MNILITIPYLFLDNLGAKHVHPYFRDDILFPLLRARNEQQYLLSLVV
ncbi:hypothetical protein OC709_02275 ['Planchonia careya' phytoplasma]|nr:hypothetical protein ['Planchonia careya' phytoplasma]MDO8030325.1 hypothetical protein ['Planchonia careya' phytoplasma]